MRRPFGLLEALFFLSLFLTGRLINDGFQRVFVHYSGNTLIYMTIGFAGFFLFVWLGLRPATERRDRWRWIVMTVTFFSIISLLWFRQVQVRHGTTAIEGYNDGVVQTLEASNALLRGENPYQTDYRQTRFGYFASPAWPNADNVAYTHFVYPPAVFLLMTPFVWLQNHLSSWVDVQSLGLVYFMLLAALMIWSQRSWGQRQLVTLLTVGNPLLWLYALSGFNDQLFVLCLVATALFIMRGRWRAAGIVYGLALASKQTAWLTLPLMAAWWWFTWRQNVSIHAELRRFFVWVIGTTLVFYLPFFLWSPADLWSDLVVYPSGSIPFTYPISGWTILQYLRVWGIISSPWTVVPAGIFQALIALPLYVVSTIQLRRDPKPQRWLGFSAMVILGVTLMSRFGADNYFYAIGLLLLGVYALSAHEDQRNDNALVNTSR